MVPDTFHFVFGLKPQDEPFHICWYLCLRSCIQVNKPGRILFHYQEEPWGPWWERIRPELELVKVDEVDDLADALGRTGLEENDNAGEAEQVTQTTPTAANTDAESGNVAMVAS